MSMCLYRSISCVRRNIHLLPRTVVIVIEIERNWIRLNDQFKLHRSSAPESREWTTIIVIISEVRLPQNLFSGI